MKFSDQIEKFNLMYKLPYSAVPTLEVGVPLVKRLTDFKSILAKELSEIDDLIDLAEKKEMGILTELDARVLWIGLQDLLGDIQIYCASEMGKFGIPLDDTLSTIMDSNFSKLDADGNPIYDEEGKVQKGPSYYKPEPKLLADLGKKLDNLDKKLN